MRNTHHSYTNQNHSAIVVRVLRCLFFYSHDLKSLRFSWQRTRKNSNNKVNYCILKNEDDEQRQQQQQSERKKSFQTAIEK